MTVLNYKSYLFTLAYNLLGEIREAEDIVQDTFEKWLNLNQSSVQNPKSYLSRMVINQSIDRLKELQKKRETYKGLWMPEPIVESLDTNFKSSEEKQIDYALLFLIEKLNPYERAVFILRESFDMDYKEISYLIDQKEDNCRQIMKRSREKLQKPKKQHKINPQKYQELLEAFLEACHEQNLEKLEKVLKKDIALYSDGGGKVAAALKPLFGYNKVTRFLMGVLQLQQEEDLAYQPIRINQKPAALIFNNTTKEIDSVVSLDIDEEGVSSVFIMRNKDKIHL